MTSYATIEKIDGNVVRILIEDIPYCYAKYHRDYSGKTIPVYANLNDIQTAIPDIEEGDVIIVEHEIDAITMYIQKDTDEKERRTSEIKEIIKRLKSKHTLT